MPAFLNLPLMVRIDIVQLGHDIIKMGTSPEDNKQLPSPAELADWLPIPWWPRPWLVDRQAVENIAAQIALPRQLQPARFNEIAVPRVPPPAKRRRMDSALSVAAQPAVVAEAPIAPPAAKLMIVSSDSFVAPQPAVVAEAPAPPPARRIRMNPTSFDAHRSAVAEALRKVIASDHANDVGTVTESQESALSEI